MFFDPQSNYSRFFVSSNLSTDVHVKSGPAKYTSSKDFLPSFQQNSLWLASLFPTNSAIFFKIMKWGKMIHTVWGKMIQPQKRLKWACNILSSHHGIFNSCSALTLHCFPILRHKMKIWIFLGKITLNSVSSCPISGVRWYMAHWILTTVSTRGVQRYLSI